MLGSNVERIGERNLRISNRAAGLHEEALTRRERLTVVNDCRRSALVMLPAERDEQPVIVVAPVEFVGVLRAVSVILAVVGAFILIWFSTMRGVQDTNRQLLEAALKRANAEPPAPVVVQYPANA